MIELLPSTPEWAWLAGLLEGEGSFGIAVSRKSDGSVYEYPRVLLNMTDRDVVERAATMMGAHRVYHHKAKKDKHRDQFKCKVHGDLALELMRRVRPMMGERRSARIDELLSREAWGRVD